MRSRAVAPAVVLALLVTATAAAFWREAGAPWDAYGQPGARETAVDVVPGGVVGLDVAATGERELCLTCHAGIEEMSRSHPLELGCVVCHGGQPLALDKDVAHQDWSAAPTRPRSTSSSAAAVPPVWVATVATAAANSSGTTWRA